MSDRAARIVVVGGGPAGVFAALGAKQHHADSDVVLVNNESCEPYEKPPLSKAVLLGTAAPVDAPIAGSAGIESRGVKLLAGESCVRIDREARQIVLASTQRLSYDALVIATGARPVALPQLPPGTPGVHYLRTEADARALRFELAPDRKLLIVGGGLIGLEVAAAAATIGAHVTVMEMAPRILLRACDEAMAAHMHRVHVARGVDVREQTTLAGPPERHGRRFHVATTRGERLEADLIVVGIGVIPEETLARDAGLHTESGIIVDEYCRSSDPLIFAAGDAARVPTARGLVRLENWRHAQDQGLAAGRNAAGAAEPYRVLPSFWSEQYDLYLQSVGWPDAVGTPVRRPMKDETALQFTVSDGYVAHAVGINAQRDIAIARRLIERQVPVDISALADPERPLASLLTRR